MTKILFALLTDMNQTNALRPEFWGGPRWIGLLLLFLFLKAALEKSYRKTKKNISPKLVFYLFFLFSVSFLEGGILLHIQEERASELAI